MSPLLKKPSVFFSRFQQLASLSFHKKKSTTDDQLHERDKLLNPCFFLKEEKIECYCSHM
jgi:hypothetical protein